MLLPALLTSDLHLTVNPADEYRWSFLKWLADQVVTHHVRSLVILGDLTDAKDNHSALLTNGVVDALAMLSWVVDQIYVLQGNHDYLKKGQSYFSFLSHLPKVKFISRLTAADDDEGPPAYFLPHTKTPGADWAGLDFSHYAYLFMHQTVKGAVSSNGQEMDGEEFPFIQGPKIYSGDIHVPQVIKGIEYVGSPYPVHFGDSFTPRCVFIDHRNRASDIHFETIARLAPKVSSLAELKRLRIRKGDQVKLTITLERADLGAWAGVRREAAAIVRDRGAELTDLKLAIARSERRLSPRQGGRRGASALSDPEAVLRFVEREELGPDALEAGLEILR